MSNKKYPYLQEGEQILHEETGTLVRSKFSATVGRIVITDKRLLFIGSNFFLFMFGLLGLLLNNHFAKTPKLDVALSDIANVEQIKYGLNKKVFKLTTRDGSEHVLTTTKDPEECMKYLKK